MCRVSDPRDDASGAPGSLFRDTGATPDRTRRRRVRSAVRRCRVDGPDRQPAPGRAGRIAAGDRGLRSADAHRAASRGRARACRRAVRNDAGSLFARRIGKGLETSDADLAAARDAIARLRGEAEALLFAEADIVILPAMPIATPLVAACEPDAPEFSARTLYALAAHTRFVSALGLPAVVRPGGRDENGMPIGVQIVARHGADRALLAFAAGAATNEALQP